VAKIFILGIKRVIKITSLKKDLKFGILKP
jgi:hypothetical protein